MSGMQERTDTNQEAHPALTVRTDVYEGPLEVLLTLIQKRKLFINDLSLTQVTDDFLAYINEQESFPVEISTQFLETASTLMLLKSKSLLPDLDISSEEEEDIQDLEARLELYKRFKTLSEHIYERWCATPLYNRSQKPEPSVVFSPTDELHRETLHRTMHSIIEELPGQDDIPQAEVKQQVSLKETIERLSSRVQRALRTRFSDIAGYTRGGTYNKEERVHIVIHFLAMLELVKTGVVDATQQRHYDDIELENTDIDVPSYTDTR